MRIVRFIICTLLLAAWTTAAAQTDCGYLALPVDEDFDGYGSGERVLPPCWYATRNYDMGQPPHITEQYYHSGGTSLVLYPGTLSGSHYSMAIAPPLNSIGLDGLQLRFWLLATSTAARIEVGVCEDTLRQARAFRAIDTLHVDQSMRWQEVVIDLDRYTGVGRRLAFRMQRSLQADAAECYIDDVRVESCGVSNIAVEHIASTRLTLRFERFGTGNVQVSYGDNVISDAQSPLTIMGLEPQTTYTFTIGCGGGVQHTVSATTMEGAGLTPAYYQPFASMPAGWRFPAGGTPAVSGGRLHMTPTGTDSCVAVLPLQEATAMSDLNVALRLASTGTTRLLVGVMEYADEPESFTAVDTLICTTQEQQHLVSLASYSGAGNYIALMGMGSGTVTVDEVRVARCLLDNLRLYNLTESEVTVAWDTLTLSAGVQIEYGPRGFTVGEGINLQPNACPYTIENLDMGSDYDLYLWPTCGDEVCAYDKLQFTTFAHRVLPPYCIDFEETAALPQGWVGTGATITGNSYSGSRALRLAAGGQVCMPLLDTAAANTVWLEFFASGNGTLSIGTAANAYATPTVQTTATGGVWQHYSLPLTGVAGRCITLQASGIWNIDALTLHTATVVSASVSNIGQHGATVYWQLDGADSAEVEYNTVTSADADFTTGTGTTAHTTNSIELSGLQANSHYAIHIRPLGDSTGCYPTTLHLRTLADSVELPYCENFEGITVSGYPDAWRRRSDMGEYPLVSTERNKTGSRSLHLAASNTLYTTAVLPDVAGCSTHRTLAFWTNMTTASVGAMLVVGSMTDIDNESTFSGIDTINLSSIEVWQHHEIGLSATAGHLVLRLIGGNAETHLFIDDLCLDACAARNVRLTSVQQDRVTLAWNGDGVAGVVAHVRGSTTVDDTFYTSPAVIEGLGEDLTYYIYVEALCDCGGSGVSYVPGGASNGNASNRQVYFVLNTLPSAVNLPICTSFEGYSTGSYPSGWRRRGSVAISDRNYYSSGHSLEVDSGSYIIMPQLRANGNVVVSFNAYSSEAASLSDSAIIIGITTNPDSISSMTVLDTLHLDALGEWKPLASNLGTAADSGKFIAIHSASRIYLDDLSIARAGIGDASVNSSGIIDWQQWGCSGVAIEYGPAGFVQGTGTKDTAIAPPYLANLADHTLSYDFYLKPFGGGASCQKIKLSLGSTTAVPYCEGFDLAPSGGMPQGWNIGRTHNSTPSIYTLNGDKTLYLSATTTSKSIAVLPALATDAIEDLNLNLSLRSSNSNRAMLLVGEITNAADPNTFYPRDTLTCATSNTWQTKRLQLNHFTGNGRIALACVATAQTAEIWIDSIGVTQGQVPTISAVSARRAQVVYTSTDTNYLEYGPEGFIQGNGTIVKITQSPYYVENLEPDSTYWFYSRKDSTSTTCLAPLSVTMPTVVDLPYCHQRDTVEQLILPEFNIDSVKYLNLYLNILGSNRVLVGVMGQRGDWSSFTVIDTIPNASHIAFTNYTGDGRFVALRALNNGNFVVDNLMVTECQLPTVTLEDDGNVMVRGNGVIEYNGVRIAVTDSIILTNLADTTEYEFYQLCNMSDVVCGDPVRLTTSMTVALPYCTYLTNTLPSGWTVETGSATVSGGVLTLTPGTIVKLPVIAENDFVLEYEQLTANGWQLVQSTGHQRPVLRADNGTARIRNIIVDRCGLPTHLDIAQTGNGTISISWDENYTGFYIGYRIQDDTATHILYADSQPLVITVESDTIYELTMMCDTQAVSCRPTQLIRTLATSVALPYCHDFDPFNMTALPLGWRVSHSNNATYLILPQADIDSLRHLNVSFTARGNGTMTLGTMSDAGNLATFDSLTVFSLNSNNLTRYFQVLTNYYGSGRFIALRIADTTGFNIGRIVISSCAAFNITIIEHEADHVVFAWQQQGSPTVSIEYGQQGFATGSGTTIQATTSPYRIDGLSPLTNYSFYVTSGCPQDSLCQPLPVIDTFYTFTPQGGTGCIDYTDLLATYVTCSSGSYTNPSLNNGAIDYGYLSADSRHTVHYDTTERDPRTGGLLRTVPEGESSSVRLGNWLTGGSNGPQAESLTYALNVDSGDVDLLILQYAAVLQDAEHSSTLQPRFRLEILNASGMLIDSCGMADFIANANLGWNQAANDVLWKDWTTVGLDLTPYAGQTIFIRLTTYDCGEGSHYGYAYFTLRCATKRMETEGCSTVPTYRFTVPSGFNYRWYTNLSDTTASTSRSILVPSDNSVTYFCHLTAIDNPSCGFYMSAFAGARYPLALFDTALSVANCQFTLQLTDRSTISFDGINPVGTDEPCETIQWLLPSGDTTTTAQQSLVLTDTGTYNITLVAGIASNQCIDTITKQIHITYPYPHTSLSGNTERCFNDAPTLLTLHHAASSEWADSVFGLTPWNDTIASVIAVDTNGCTDTLHHTLVVHPIYNIADKDTVCSSNLGYTWRDTSFTFTIADTGLDATTYRQSQYGCDSTMTLALRLWPSYDLDNIDTICNGNTLTFIDTTLATAGDHLHQGITQHGCDSLVTMHLTVMPVYTIYDPRSVCDSLRWRDGILYTADTSGATDSLTTAFGCDSVIVLQLSVHPSHFIADTDSVCSSNLQYTWRDTSLSFTIYDSAIDATLSRQTAYGCDSIMTIALTLWQSYDLHHSDTICDDAPISFFDSVLTTTGDYLHPGTTLQGCDSLVTMHLTVNPTYLIYDPRSVCDSLRWRDGILYTTDTSGASDSLTTAFGCDSVIVLQLSVHPSHFIADTDSVCSSNLQYTWRDTSLSFTIYDSAIDATLSRQTAYGCDSIMTIALTLWQSYDLHHSDTICDDAPISFFDSVLTTTGDYLHPGTTLQGCDSLVTMHLTVNSTYRHNDTHSVCDSLRWINGLLYVDDTAGIDDTLATMHGCDSVLTLQLTIYRSYLNIDYDTFCEADTYLFRSHELTSSGFYADTLTTIDGCDSVLAIDLYERPLPQVAIRVERNCDSARYELHAETNVPYIEWQWGDMVSGRNYQSFDSIIYDNPRRSETYRLYAAYTDWPQCMASDSITLSHFVVPEALLRVSPQTLAPDNTHFDAYNYGNEWPYRQWYLDGVLQDETSYHLEGYADPDADTLNVMLVVGSEYCSDTATAAIAIRHMSLFVPTAFTPDADPNRTFFAVGHNLATFEMDIYNRQGALVFHADDINSPWDGRNLSGDPCPTGNYVYRIRYSTIYQPAFYQSEVGTVLLIR